MKALLFLFALIPAVCSAQWESVLAQDKSDSTRGIVRIPALIMIGDGPPIAKCYIYQRGISPDSTGIVIWIDPQYAPSIFSSFARQTWTQTKTPSKPPEMSLWMEQILESIVMDTTGKK